MDVTDLKIDSCSIDVAIDKVPPPYNLKRLTCQGTMDALLCSSGSVWSPSEEIILSCKKEVDEVLRILKSGGRFIYISFGQPHFRLPHLERSEWKEGVKTTVLGDGGIIQYFFYVMEKR
jgi:EEF1A lysine methyltransferase 4